jgi:hypothetical protein
MTKLKLGGSVRKAVTGVLARGALLSLYAFSLVGATAVVMTTGVSTAQAQRGRGRGRSRAGAAAVGATIGIIGGIIAADAARRGRGASEDEIEYCIERFKSYDVESQTYMGFDGERHPCP